jgi:hypothetical protein
MTVEIYPSLEIILYMYLFKSYKNIEIKYWINTKIPRLEATIDASVSCLHSMK